MITIISEKNIEKTKDKIRKSEHPIIVIGKDDKYNRKILEYGQFDILASPEIGELRKDNPKQLDSGINSIMARIASKNKVSIGIDLKSIKNLSKEEKALRIARIKQNIQTCKRTKTRIEVLNQKTKNEGMSFMLSLGATTKQAKEASDKSISF